MSKRMSRATTPKALSNSEFMPRCVRRGKIQTGSILMISHRWTNFTMEAERRQRLSRPGFTLQPGMHLLDVGSGLGGPARYFARYQGCRVTGIDLTEEFVAVARTLTSRLGMDGQISFQQGSALSMPFAAASFDVATLLHVGMNIADKDRLFSEVRRVVKPGGIFGIYDQMREADGELAFPVPWASVPQTSFVETAATYKRR